MAINQPTVFDLLTCKIPDMGKRFYVNDWVEVDRSFLLRFYPRFTLNALSRMEGDIKALSKMPCVGRVTKISASGNFYEVALFKPERERIVAPCNVLSLLPIETLVLNENEVEV